MVTWPRTAGTIPLNMIQDRRFSRREELDGGDFGQLVKSIEIAGMIVPIIVTDTYEVVDGMRRVRAARALGLTELPGIATNNYRTVAGHMIDTRWFTESNDLPALPYVPRALADHINMLSELHRRGVYAQRHRQSKTRFRGTTTKDVSEFNDDMLDIFGWSRSHTICTRTIFGLEQKLQGRTDAEATAVSTFLAKWEAEWPNTLTPSSAKTRIYELVRRAGAVRNYDKPALPQPIVFTAALTRQQQQAFDETLIRMSGAVGGLLAMSELSPKLADEKLNQWHDDLTVLLRNIRTIRGTINRAMGARSASTSEESTP